MSIVLETEGDMEQGRQYGEEAMLRRLGQLARQRREEIGMGRDRMAEELKIGSGATIRDFEFGRTRPYAMTLRKFERGLHWRSGVIDELLAVAETRNASDVSMEDLDAFDAAPESTLENVPTPVLLRILADRIEKLQSGMGGSILPRAATTAPGTQDLYGMAASGHIPEHLEKEFEGKAQKEPDEGPASN
jgi:transcriptional regulator with XRE-family HTH domain